MSRLVAFAFIASLAACASETTEGPIPDPKTIPDATEARESGKLDSSSESPLRLTSCQTYDIECRLGWAGTTAYCGPDPDWRRCWAVQFRDRVVACCRE